MKKQFSRILMAAAAFIALTAGTTMAQNGRFSVGAELGLPLGDFGDGVGIGFGGSLRYELPIGDNMGITGTAGYMIFSGKDQDLGFGFTIEGANVSLIPIMAGFKYYFNEAQDGFYAMVELGVAISKADVEGAESSTDFNYAPGIGYHMENLDFGLRYQLFSQETTVVEPITGTSVTSSTTQGFLGLRAAYVFGEK